MMPGRRAACGVSAVTVVLIGAAVAQHVVFPEARGSVDGPAPLPMVLALASLVLVGIYLVVVTSLTAVIAPVTGDSLLAVAAATLAAAAAFQPARRRIQATMDRRFNRSRCDARQTVERFSSHLRSEVDLDDVQTGVVATIDDVLKPTHPVLWVRSAAVKP